MKKLVLIITATILASTAWAQSQLQTVKGKTKDGKSINVQYYKGTAQDHIESVKYQLVDELKADNTKKQNSINDLQSQLNKANKKIDKLNDQLKNCGNAGQIAELNEQINQKDNTITQLNEELEQLRAQLKEKEAENNKLKTQVDSLKRANLQLSLNKKRPAKHPVIGVEASMGSVFYSLNNPWKRDLSWNKQAAVYFGTDRLTESFPLSVEIGIGFRNLPMAAHFVESKGIEQTDFAGDTYQPDYKTDGYSEKLTMNCLEVPIRLCIGQPSTDKISVYGKIGVTPSLALSSSLAQDGKYSINGYYRKWNVTFEDIPELGFVSDLESTNNAETDEKRFFLWGNATLGAYVPVSSSLLFNVGAKVDYPFIKTSPKGTNPDIPTRPDGLTLYKGGIFIPNLQAGLVYKL